MTVQHPRTRRVSIVFLTTSRLLPLPSGALAVLLGREPNSAGGSFCYHLMAGVNAAKRLGAGRNGEKSAAKCRSRVDRYVWMGQCIATAKLSTSFVETAMTIDLRYLVYTAMLTA